MRSEGLLDNPGEGLPSKRHCDLLMRAASISHPNLLRTIMVYPIVYEQLKDPVGGADNQARARARPTFTGVPPKKGKYR